MKTEKKSGAARTQLAVTDEWWSDERVSAFLAMQMKQGTPWGWVVFSGIASFLLGLMIVSHWPASSFFVLGLLLGIDLIFVGSGWIATGLALRRHARS